MLALTYVHIHLDINTHMVVHMYHCRKLHWELGIGILTLSKLLKSSKYQTQRCARFNSQPLRESVKLNVKFVITQPHILPSRNSGTFPLSLQRLDECTFHLLNTGYLSKQSRQVFVRQKQILPASGCIAQFARKLTTL